MIFDMLKKRAAAARQRRYDEGWDYAAGRLLREGKGCITDLEVHVEMSRMSGMYDEFDDGIMQAIGKWRAWYD